MNVLVVVAHPDDEALGCGGALAKLSDQGNKVTVLLPTRRCDGRGRAEWRRLLSDLERSCGILGADFVILDPLLDETEAETHLHVLHDAILPSVEAADLVLTHWTGDVNQVHRGVARAVEIATRPFRRRRDVSLFEIPTSSNQGFATPIGVFAPSQYVILTEAQARRKCDAVACYATEMAPGRTPDDVDRQLRSRGAEIGTTFAEAFAVARQFV